LPCVITFSANPSLHNRIVTSDINDILLDVNRGIFYQVTTVPIPKSLEDRGVFQVDQAEPEDQAVLRPKQECCLVPVMGRNDYLSANL
jgi:hypothetical protein